MICERWALAPALLSSGNPPVSPPVLQHPGFHLLGFVLVVKSQPGFLCFFCFCFTCQSGSGAAPPPKTDGLLDFLAARQQSFSHSSAVTSRVTQDALESTSSASLDNPCCFSSSWSSRIVKYPGNQLASWLVPASPRLLAAPAFLCLRNEGRASRSKLLIPLSRCSARSGPQPLTLQLLPFCLSPLPPTQSRPFPPCSPEIV